MDSKGLYTIDFLFSIFFTLIIGIVMFNIVGTNLENEKIIEEDLNGRTLIDEIANIINQVNSNYLGYGKTIEIPYNISENYFSLTINQNEVLLEFKNKKAESKIIPVRIININNDLVDDFKMYPGNSYKIKKSIDKNNMTGVQVYKIN
ncbi:hypothetical protein SDC9_08625 [bioreactor metagenome]|uniref:Uncharacterized protein n=1 Tax=bioreactor metagenome TaxID=1076179 RepID=A0A644T7U8_9ZZZZ|nr:hypothetical protein [Methanobrevibacter sp.]MEA4957663.1 hypothetical protein [Methanobrevibacter sp.]